MNSSAGNCKGPVYRADDVRELDRIAINAYGMAGYMLMQRAGQAAFDVLQHNFDERRIRVYCGAGNNAGDGYIVAGLAFLNGYDVKIIDVGGVDHLQGDALRAYQWTLDLGVITVPFDPTDNNLLRDGIIVDGLLGTGLKGDVQGKYAQAMDQINGSKLPVLALDIPSGLAADTGKVLGVAVKASHTITFIGQKRGCFTGDGLDYVGKLHYHDLGVPGALFDQVASHVRRVNVAQLLELVQPRAKNSHKGRFGHVLIIGGGLGFGGAVVMAAQAALRCGAGLVSAATRPEYTAAILARQPEIMAKGVESGQALQPLLKQHPDVIVIGPGLGQGAWGQQLLKMTLDYVKATNTPVVIDADGLNLLAQLDPQQYPQPNSWILTPHPGEAARLLGCDLKDINDDRFHACQQLIERYRCTLVLKGAGSLIANEQGVHINGSGNPGMASGGMGDVLSGMMGGLLAQNLADRLLTTVLAVYLHGRAADLAVASGHGERGLAATDLLPFIQKLVNGKDFVGD